MKRYLKIFFSRFFLIAMTIILTFAVNALVIILAVYFAEEALATYFPAASPYVHFIFWFAQWLVVLVTVLSVVNRDMLPETKIPWILCVVVLNVFGVAIYIVFSYNRPSRKHRRAYALLNERSRPFARRAFSQEALKERMGDRAPLSEALFRSNPNAVAYGNTKTEYFPTGEAFFERLLGDLEQAKEYIFLEYFILARGKMWYAVLDLLKQKVQEGVEVRVIYDDIGCMGKLRAGYYKELQKAGIACVKFNPFVPIVTNLHNNRDHRKIVVIDGKVGYTGGINLADEYINEIHPFGQWKDTAVRLEGEGVKGLILMFLRLYNLRAKEAEDFSPYIPENYENACGEGIVQPYGDGPRPLYGRHLAEDVYIGILSQAKDYVWIMTPYLIIDYRMRAAMLSAAARGVDVRVIVPHIPDKKIPFALTRSNYMALIQGGVKIYEYTPGFIHAKSFLSDDDIAVVGTINLDYRSLLHHFEDAVLLYRTEANRAIKEDYLETFGQSALQTEEDAKRSVVWRGICEIAKVFAPMF